MRNNILKGENLELAAATLSSIGDGVISVDCSGYIIYINKKAEEILDMSANELIGKEYKKVLHFYKADSHTSVKCPIMKTISNGEIYGLEHDTVILTKDNKQKYISATCSPVKKLDENIIGAVIVLRDITRLKLTEKENEAVRANFTLMFMNAPVGIAILDADINIIEVNDSALKYFDQKRNSVLGKHFGDAFHCISSLESKLRCGQERECKSCFIRKSVKTAILHGKKTSEIEFSKTFIVNHKEKEFWFKASINPLFVGDKTNAVITWMDITENKNKEIALIKARDYSNNILDQIPSLVWKTDKNIVCNYVNKSWIDYTGTSLEESSGYGWADIIHPKDLDLYVSARTSAMYTMESFHLEARILHSDGSYRWCHIVGDPYFDLDKQYAGYIGSINDINEQKEAEVDLMRYRKIIHKARDIIFFLDLEGNIIEANQNAIGAYGYTNEELCSMNIRHIREDWGYTKKQMEEADKSGILFEAVHRRKDGSCFPVEVSSQGTRIGTERVIFSVVRDITDRKKAEAKINENHIKYRSLFMNMQNGYAYYNTIYDNDNKLVDLKFKEVNEAFERLFGLKKKKLIDKNHSEIFHNSIDMIAQIISRNLYKLTRGESVHVNEYYSSTYDKWLSLSVYSPKANDIVTIISDISPMKQTELRLIAAKEAAEAANKAKSEFLANMSHEIRTPINGMVGMVDLTLITELEEEQKENLLMAKECAGSLLKIINDVLDFSKMEVGKLVIENINFNIKQLIEDIVKTHTSRIEEKGLEFNYVFSSTIPQFLVGDPNRIRQILNNMISNALKFTQKGSITVSVKKLKGNDDEIELNFSVCDTGIGIAPEDIDKLFKSFSQIETSFTKKFGGTGLGLAISKNLVEMMDGKIGVDSQKGIGSTFYFTLKFKIGIGIKETTNVLPRITRTTKPLRILLAEDDAINQMVIRKILQEKGHIVDTANNGVEALELFEPGAYDVILMDIQMPVMNGVEAAQKIKEKEDYDNHTPIIAVTAYALQGDRERFLSLGMDEYLTKPIKMDELFHTLDKVALIKESTPSLSLYELQPDYANHNLNAGRKVVSDIMIKQVAYLISKNIERLEKASKYNDFLKMEDLAHEIKSLSSDIEADDIKDNAFRIELASRRGDIKEAIRGIKRIKSELNIINKTND